VGGGAAKSPLGYSFFLTEIRLLFIHPDLPPFLKEGWGGFFIKIKIPLASPFVKGRNYFKSPCITAALPPFPKMCGMMSRGRRQ